MNLFSILQRKWFICVRVFNRVKARDFVSTPPFDGEILPGSRLNFLLAMAPSSSSDLSGPFFLEDKFAITVRRKVLNWYELR